MKLLLTLSLLLSVLFAKEYKLDSQNSNVYFKAHSSVLFFGSDEIVGINKSLEGKLTRTFDGVNAKLRVLSAGFNTQNERRDTHIKEILQSSKHPYINFHLKREFQSKKQNFLEGSLFINGKSKEVVFAVTKKITKKGFIYLGKTILKYEDFGIKPPSLAGFIKQAEPNLEVGAKLHFKEF